MYNENNEYSKFVRENVFSFKEVWSDKEIKTSIRFNKFNPKESYIRFTVEIDDEIVYFEALHDLETIHLIEGDDFLDEDLIKSIISQFKEEVDKEMVAKRDSKLKAVIDVLNAEIAKDRPLFESTGPFNGYIIRKKDKSYRTKSFTGSEEFLLKAIREGKRSDFVFEFEPIEDSDEFIQMELTRNQISTIAKPIEEWAVKVLDSGFPDEKPNSSIGIDTAITNFMKRKNKIDKKTAKELEEAMLKEMLEKNSGDTTWGIF